MTGLGEATRFWVDCFADSSALIAVGGVSLLFWGDLAAPSAECDVSSVSVAGPATSPLAAANLSGVSPFTGDRCVIS